MRALSANLRAGVLRSDAVRHALTKGEMREEDLAAALAPHLPQRMSLSSGVVINDRGEESGQQDLLIVDSDVSPAFVTAGRLGVHPVESVLAAIEVKSTLTSALVEDAVERGASGAETSSRALFRAFVRANQALPEMDRTNALFVVDQFTTA
ncbi:hypothetical protein C8N24_0225 [Solirubrobacter pauli]|uniref:DUF6602 domain-containing protein n=1 Tax=Solirubrobacter pauli TaxID=166793 RepID=A0A660L939_9ACTN|nr:DUF6602 domain-containing protein [Solirubrobacter pauli]RKQ90423.1 hypothetical protein C8N24_0225 [Solirubrobacter pauli]